MLTAVGSDVVVDTLSIDQVVSVDAKVATTASVKPDTGRGWRSALVVEDAEGGASGAVAVTTAVMDTLRTDWDGNTESSE